MALFSFMLKIKFSAMIKRKLTRSRKGEYSLTLSGLKKEHVQLLYSIFSNISLHRCKGIVDIGSTLKGMPVPYECLETLIPIDYCARNATLQGLSNLLFYRRWHQSVVSDSHDR